MVKDALDDVWRDAETGHAGCCCPAEVVQRPVVDPGTGHKPFHHLRETYDRQVAFPRPGKTRLRWLGLS